MGTEVKAIRAGQANLQDAFCKVEDGEVWLWNWQSSQVVATLKGHAGRLTALQFSPDGKRLVTASLDGTAKLWGVGTTRCQATFAPGIVSS